VTINLGVQLDGKADVEDTMSALVAIPEVQVVHWVTGHFDLIVTLCVDDISRFQRVLLQRIRRIPGFLRSESMISLIHWRRVGGQFAFIWPSPSADDLPKSPFRSEDDEESADSNEKSQELDDQVMEHPRVRKETEKPQR
jgi:hypothetical protein